MSSRLLLFASAISLLGLSAAGRAQAPDPHRFGLALTGGFTILPAAFQWSCGNSADGGGVLASDIGAAALFRPRRWIVLQADTRYNKPIMLSNCAAVLYPADTEYDRSLERSQVVMSALRIGLETPPTVPILLLRATAGAGLTWSSPALPVTVVSVGVGAHNRGARFLAEWERVETTAHATAYMYHAPGFGPWPAMRVITHPTWYSVRLGLELPLGSASDGAPTDSRESP